MPKAQFGEGQFEQSFLVEAILANGGGLTHFRPTGERFLEFAHHTGHGPYAQAERILDLVREERVSPHHQRHRKPLDCFVPLAGQIAVALEEGGTPTARPAGSNQPSELPWLSSFKDEGVRAVLRHIAKHRYVAENDAARMLGSMRAMRRFSRALEDIKANAPFDIKIEVVSNVKRFVQAGAR